MVTTPPSHQVCAALLLSMYMFEYCSFPCHPRLSTLPTYYIPKDGPLQTYKEYINQLPNVDHPEAFGQHSNADIASQIKETRYICIQST